MTPNDNKIIFNKSNQYDAKLNPVTYKLSIHTSAKHWTHLQISWSTWSTCENIFPHDSILLRCDIHDARYHGKSLAATLLYKARGLKKQMESCNDVDVIYTPHHSLPFWHLHSICHATTDNDNGSNYKSTERKLRILPYQLINVRLYIGLLMLWFISISHCLAGFFTSRKVTNSAPFSDFNHHYLFTYCRGSYAQADHSVNDVRIQSNIHQHKEYHGQIDLERTSRKS